jgi:hypothetical protein
MKDLYVGKRVGVPMANFTIDAIVYSISSETWSGTDVDEPSTTFRVWYEVASTGYRFYAEYEYDPSLVTIAEPCFFD